MDEKVGLHGIPRLIITGAIIALIVLLTIGLVYSTYGEEPGTAEFEDPHITKTDEGHYIGANNRTVDLTAKNPIGVLYIVLPANESDIGSYTWFESENGDIEKYLNLEFPGYNVTKFDIDENSTTVSKQSLTLFTSKSVAFPTISSFLLFGLTISLRKKKQRSSSKVEHLSEQLRKGEITISEYLKKLTSKK